MTLKTKTVLLVAGVFVAVLAGSYALYGWLRADVVSGLGGLYAEKQVLYNRSRTLHPLMRELALARKLADSSTLKDWARAESDPMLRAAALRELEEYRRFFSDRSCFFVAHASGHYYYNDRANRYAGVELRYTLDPQDPEDAWYYGTAAGTAPYQLNVDYDEKLRVTKVWINVVVRDANEVVGVVGTGIDLSEFLRAAVASDQAGITNVFVEEGGAVQAFDDVERIDFRSISKAPSERKTIFQWLDGEEDRARLRGAMDALRDAPDGAVEILVASMGEQQHLLGLAYLREIGWYTVCLVDVDQLLGTGRFAPFALLLLAALGLLSGALVILLDRLVLSRIARLDDSVREFTSGSLPPVPAPRVRDEVGRLEEGFQLMAETVLEHTRELENRVAARTRELGDKNQHLERALAEIRTLSGLLPTCMYCKKIRDQEGHWNHMEAYIGQRTEARFSHGICPECLDRAREEV